MKRKGRIFSAVMVLALGFAAAPAGAVSGGGPWSGWDVWTALWERTVCLVQGCAESIGSPATPDRRGAPRSIFAQHGMCIDPNGGPSSKACAESQTLEPRIHTDH